MTDSQAADVIDAEEETGQPPSKTQRLTNSRKNCFDACKRMHFLSYECGIRRAVDAQPLRFGSAVHIARESWKLDRNEARALELAVTEYDATRHQDMTPEQYSGWLVEREQIVRLFSGWVWRWSEMESTMETIASEFEFNVPIINPETGKPSRLFTLAGKIDGIVRLPDGRLANEEFKTTADDIAPDSDYWKRLRIDAQVSTYVLAARCVGHAVETSLYDVIKKPKTKPKVITQAQAAQLVRTGKYASNTKDDADVYGQYNVTYEGEMPLPQNVKVGDQYVEIVPGKKGFAFRETVQMYGDRLTFDIGQRPDEYYARHEIPRLQADLDEAQWDIWQTAKMLRDCQRNERWPKATRSCIGFGRCPYFDLCANGYDHTSGDVPDGYMKVDNVHQELKGQ